MSIILNNSLSNSQICTILSNSYTTRTSSTTIKNSVIFPASGIIFLLKVHDDNVLDDLNLRVSKMLNLHKNCYIICVAKPDGADLNFDDFFIIQTKYMFSKLKIMPVRNEPEACQCMDILAKAHHKKGASILWEKLSANLEMELSDPYKIIKPFRQSGFSEYECFMLLDNLGSVENVLTASYDEILKAVQCKKLADKTFNFFNKNN